MATVRGEPPAAAAAAEEGLTEADLFILGFILGDGHVRESGQAGIGINARDLTFLQVRLPSICPMRECSSLSYSCARGYGCRMWSRCGAAVWEVTWNRPSRRSGASRDTYITSERAQDGEGEHQLPNRPQPRAARGRRHL
eukprot:COSAG01_NODE_32377_length_582_cov_1.776398_1_plen_139_part_10